MSVHVIYKGNGGAKMMRPVPNREEYLKLRNGGFQKDNVARIRQGDEALGIPSDKPGRWIALGAAMAIQENGITSIDWFAMLRGWEMARQ